MRRLIAARVAQGVLVIALVAVLTFVLIHLAPGDPIDRIVYSEMLTEEVRATLRRSYGLDRPLPEQFLRWMANVARGDFGWSFSQHRPVRAALATAIPNTIVLMGAAILASFALGVAAAVVQAARPRRALDRGTGGVLLLLYSVPAVWLGLMLIVVFAQKLSLFPTSGIVDPVLYPYLGPWGRLVDRLRHLALPVATLTLGTAAAVARFQRAALLDVLGEDFVRTARAKGVRARAVLLRHALRNALAPTIALLGLALPALFGGAVLVETIFAWPGMGLLATGAVAARDYPLVIACAILGAALVVVGSLVADLLTAAANPRLRGR